MNDVVAWTDSTVVLSWLSGNPHRFKTYVGNRVAQIISEIPSERWKHVAGTDNPADCASRGIYPSELIHHQLWWNGPTWLMSNSANWPNQAHPPVNHDEMEPSDEVVSYATIQSTASKPNCIVPHDHYSSLERLVRTIGWILRFVKNCRIQKLDRIVSSHMTVPELHHAERYLCAIVQSDHFLTEIKAIKINLINLYTKETACYYCLLFWIQRTC